MIDLHALEMRRLQRAMIHSANYIAQTQSEAIKSGKLAMIQPEVTSHSLHPSETDYAVVIRLRHGRIASKLEPGKAKRQVFRQKNLKCAYIPRSSGDRIENHRSAN